MTRKERIIGILDNELKHLSIQNKTKMLIADEILSIPLDVPTNEELAIEIVARYISCNNQYRKSKIKPILQKAFIDGAEWAIDEIKKGIKNDKKRENN